MCRVLHRSAVYQLRCNSEEYVPDITQRIGEIFLKPSAYFKQESEGRPLYDVAKRVEWTANACAVKRNYHITSQEMWSFNCQAKFATAENCNRSGSMTKADVEAHSIAGHGEFSSTK
jgi:hypothetical protein